MLLALSAQVMHLELIYLSFFFFLTNAWPCVCRVSWFYQIIKIRLTTDSNFFFKLSWYKQPSLKFVINMQSQKS